DSTDWKKPDP
ncbi:MAG: hypothetical protein CO167_07750, partial [Candidatus Marinimicrobia bacterium CG_4_9_14_3_um_filter_48_9]